MRFAAAILLCASVPALADDVGDRIGAARAHLADDDPAVRDRGEAELLAVAAEAGPRLLEILRDPDAEVRARAAEMLEREGIIPVEGKTARLRTLLASFGSPAAEGEDRAAAIRETLGLHANAASLVARELREGHVSVVPDAAVVLAPGLVTVSAVVVNDGRCAAWLRPGRFRVDPDYNFFGERPNWRVARCGGCLRAVELVQDEESMEDAIVRNLSELVRVPPGARFTLASVDRNCGSCGILQLRLRYDVYLQRSETDAAAEANFSGVTVTLPEATCPLGALSPRIFLGEMRGETARATAFADGEGRGLDVTALEDLPALALCHRDPYWWAALDAKGGFLASGAFGTEEADLAALPKGETRRVRMHFDPPEGTATLWLGFTRNGEECVPAPMALK